MQDEKKNKDKRHTLSTPSHDQILQSEISSVSARIGACDDCHSVIDELPQMVFETDLHGLITYTNKRALTDFGYSMEDIAKGLNVTKVFHEDDIKRVIKNMRLLLASKSPADSEYLAQRKDGSTFPIKVYSQTVFKEGKVTGIRGTVVDITDIKETEDALRKSEAYYRALFNNTGTAMVIFGDDAVIRSSNDHFAILCGCPKESIDGKLKWSDFVAPESLEMIRGYHKERSQGGSDAPVEYEFTFLTWNKERRTVQVFIQVIPETNDRVCSLIDITDRKKAEEALRQSEERYGLVVRGANDGIWDWDLISDTVYYSPRYKAILGYEDHEFLNVADSWKNSVHPDDHDYVIGANVECIEGKVDHFEVEYRMRHKDGSWRWIHGRGASVVDETGKAYRLAGTHTDITERKIQEHTTNAMYAISKAVGTTDDLEALYKSIHSILNEVTDATNFFICIYDEDTDSAALIYWQDEVDTYGIIPNITSPETRSPTAQIIRTGKPLFLTKRTQKDIEEWEKIGSIGTAAACWIGVPLKVRDKIIGTMTVQHYSDPYRYSHNDVALMTAASEQVALAIERKRSEEALNRLNEELENNVEERTAELMLQTKELEAANKRLTELDEIKSALVSSISHELRTPLTSIRGFAKLAGKDFQRYFMPLASTSELDKKGGRINANLEIIENEGERLTRLINDFLDINRIESGNATWNDIDFNPSDIVGMAVSALSGAFAEKPDVELIAELPTDPPLITADPDKIQQVIINLLGNACKFTQTGSVTVAMTSTTDSIKVTVSDTGSGIPMEDQDDIFEKFHKSQKGDTITNMERGTGLGLAICREIVTHYGGSIWVESEEGKGSCFSFSLPTNQYPAKTPEC